MKDSVASRKLPRMDRLHELGGLGQPGVEFGVVPCPDVDHDRLIANLEEGHLRCHRYIDELAVPASMVVVDFARARISRDRNDVVSAGRPSKVVRGRLRRHRIGEEVEELLGIGPERTDGARMDPRRSDCYDSNAAHNSSWKVPYAAPAAGMVP